MNPIDCQTAHRVLVCHPQRCHGFQADDCPHAGRTNMLIPALIEENTQATLYCTSCEQQTIHDRLSLAADYAWHCRICTTLHTATNSAIISATAAERR